MKLTDRQKELFAVLFAAGEPIEAARVAEALERSLGEVLEDASLVKEALNAEDSPLELRRLEDSFQLCTRGVYAPVIRKALELRRNVPLSGAAMETLAIIAYNQPVTRGFVEQVRGVDSSSVVLSLVEKGLAEEAGRLDLPGRPLSYRTTPNFLRCFGLTALSGLPPVEDAEDETEDADEQLTLEESLAATE